MTRKFTILLMALLTLAGFKSWGQETILFENFNSSTSIPTGWTSTTNNNSGGWFVSSGAITYGSTWAYAYDGNSIFCGGDGNYNDDYLQTPEINLSNYDLASLSFRYIRRDWSGDVDGLNVYYRTSSNSTWNLLYTCDVIAYSSTPDNPNYTLANSIDLTELCGNSIYLRFENDNHYGYGVALDDILITGTASASCPAPTGLTASDITGSGATITWSGSADSYKVVYGPAEGFNPDDITPVVVSETTYTINNLTTDVTYSIAVKSVCSAEEESDWSQYSFTPTCPTITYFYYEDKTATTATLYWGVEGNTDSYALAYGASSSFDLDDPETYTLVDGITATNYLLQNLTTGTTYKCAVRAACGDAGYGNWSNPTTFTPSCPAPSYIQVASVAPTTVTLSWSGEYYVEGYTLAYGLASDFNLENPETYTSVSVEVGDWQTEYEITGLTPNVAYKCAVRSSCDGESQGEWSYPTQFTPRLEAPESLSISNIMATSATASWEASEGAANYTVAYGLASAFNLDDPTTYQTTEPTSATSVEITGLTAEQNYACAVKASVGDINSEWSNPAYFTPTAKKTLVANDGTNTSYCHAPFYGGAIMTGESSSQFIIPASELLQMSGSSVIGFDFSQYNVPYHESAGNWEIYLKEVANTTFTSDSFIEDNTMQLVYSGDLMISSYTLSITFQNSFDYEGGNLLVYFKQTQNATSWDIYTPWYGVETSGYTSVGCYNYNGNNYIQRFSFLPKTTITYIPMEKFAITLVQPENEDEIGKIAADMTEAAEGKTVTLSFNPKQYDDHSYRVSSWNVKKTDDATVTVEVADNNTFVMPAYPVTVSAAIETVPYYALTVDEEIVGGTVEAYPAEHIEFGQQVELNASPAQHYKFVEWNITKAPSGDAFPVPALPNTTFNMPASALNVSATFEAYLPHTITLPDAVAEGYVTASQTEGLYCYDNVTLTVHPATHCSLQSIDIMTGETPVSCSQDGNNYYFSMPDGDVTVTAKFVENRKYNVSLDYNEDGGSITLQGGNTEYYAGDPVNLSVAANTGYILLSLEAEDSEHNPVAIANNQFTMPEDDVTVTAEFVRGITVNDGTNTNKDVPFEGDAAYSCYTKSQFIIPESSLSALQYNIINGMVFYTSTPQNQTYSGNWDVYIKNMPATTTTLAGYIDLNEMDEKVYTGNMVIAENKMIVTFNEPISYDYGNLLICFDQTSPANNNVNTSWYGVNQSINTAYAGLYYYSYYGYEESYARKFLPKVTFLYEPGVPPTQYTITFHSNGVESERTFTEGQPLPDPTNIPAGLAFEGWAAADIATYTEEEPVYVTAARAEEDLYAVFSYGEAETASKGAGSWIKVTDVNELANDDKVVFVYNNSKIMCDRSGSIYNGYFNPGDVTVLDNVITSIPDNAIEFTLQSDGDNWKLKYVDALEDGETTLAYNNYDLYPKNYQYGTSFLDIWTAENNSGAVVFKVTDGNTRYIGYNSGFMKVVSSSGNKCNVYKASAPVVTHYYYMTEVLTNGNITADTEVKNIIVNGSITVDQFKTLSLADGGLFRNKTTANFVFNNGAQFYYNGNANATFKKSIDPYDNPTGNDGYYLIANPTDNATVAHLTENNYDLYTFDPTQALEWHNEKENNTLTSGIGYLYANSDYVTLEFAGNLRSAADDKTIDLAYYDGGEDGHEFPGFNLVGNPFACNAYVYNNAGEDFTYYTIVGSEITATTGATIPCTGIFVEASGANQQVTFSTEAPEAPASLLSLTVSQNRGNAIDRAIVRFDGSSNLHKFMLNPDHTNLSIAKDGETFAAVSSETKGELPVSFKAETTGTYTISVNTENVTAGYIHLIDNMTGTDVDLLATPSYTFIGSPRDNENRFTVKFEVSYGQDGDGDEHFAYQNGSELVINGEGTLQIFDILGRVVISEEVHGQTVNVGGLNTGAYIVRLTGESVKTQKIVVR